MLNYLRGSVRGTVLAMGLVIVVAALGIRLAFVARQHHEAEVAARMTVIAAATADPEGLTPRPGRECPDQTSLVRCAASKQTPEELASFYKAALSRASGRTATSHCETMPHGLKPTSCLVRIDDGHHAVLISIDSEVATKGGVRALQGSRIRVEAT